MKASRFVRLISFAAGLLSIVLVGQAKTYQVDPGHSTIGFDIRHLVTTVHGRFTQFKGTIDYDETTPEKSEVNFTVRASSINTENDKRDQDLRSPNFFDVSNYPEAAFVSKRVVVTEKNKALLYGDLTIHGITKPAVFDVEYLGEANAPWGERRAGFSATTSLNRKDFGITWNKALDNGGLLVGDEVKLHVDVEAIFSK